MEKKGKRNVTMKASFNGKNVLARDQQNGIDNNQYYPDPDIHKDEEIVLPKDNRQSARSRNSNTMSAKSRKTVQSGKQSEARENIVRSRGRPMKPHEAEPFLSIDNLPPEKSFVSDKSTYNARTSPTRAPKPGRQESGTTKSLEAQLQRMTAYMSPYNQQTPAPPSSVRNQLLQSFIEEEDVCSNSEMSNDGPSVVTGHIYSKRVPSSAELRTNAPDQVVARPSTQSDPKNTNVHKDNKLLNGDFENITLDANIVINDNKDSNETSTDNVKGCLATNISKLTRPRTAPPSGNSCRSVVKVENKVSQNGSRPSSGSPGIGQKSMKTRSRPSSERSKVSSRGTSRPVSRAGSGLGSNMMGVRSVMSRAGRITPANTPFHSPNKQARHPNYHVKSPFKHAVGKSDPSPDGRETPSMGMKERTALAAFHVHKMLAVAGEKDAHKLSGKLKKGKLKPLYPVNVQGPSIEQCRGIISEARSYQPSPSRTLQRRLNLIDQIPNVHEYLYERPRTVESVHQTSVASSIDDFYQDGPDTNRSLPDEILYAQEPSNLAPENTFMPEYTQEDLIGAFQAMGVDETPRMFATEVGVKDADDVTTKTDVTVSDNVQHELHVSESAEEMKDTQDVTEQTNINNNDSTADVERELPTSGFDGRNRIGSPSKSVRFAQSNESKNSKEMKQMRNETIVKQQRKVNSAGSKGADHIDDDEDVDKKVIETVSKRNKENSKATCKSEDLDVIKRKDTDDDDNDRAKDRPNGNIGNTVMPRTSGNQTTGEKGHLKEKSSEKTGSESKDSGTKRALSSSQKYSVSRPSHRSRSQSRERSGQDSSRQSQIRKSQNSAKTSKTKKDSAKNSHCSRFEQSQASKQHINKLEVSSVIHSNSVSTSLRPESPKRNRSRSSSPSRQRDQCFQFFAPMTRPCFEAPDDFDCYHSNSQRSKVKFLLEGEEPELETIFIEGDNDVDIKTDKEITYDVLDSEIAMLRTAIQNSLTYNTEAFDESNTVINEQEGTESESDSETDTLELETERENTVRGDYSNLLEKYRQKCMERSETFGAISATLVTPRDSKIRKSNKPEVVKHRQGSSVVLNEHENTRDESEGQAKVVHPTTLSDSGHGSADNLSEFSHSNSKMNVPKLELGESTSDLGMDTSRSDVTVTYDNADVVEVTNDNANGEEEDVKNLLEIVCDQLTTPVLQEKPMKRRELEEDVSNLQVIATTKSISKNSKKGSNSTTRAPFPPLCFTINARPPKGYLYYFAYGPDMNPNRFSSYIQREIKERYWGLLFGFNLVFNKRGTSEEAGGFANIEFNPVRSVEGCIYKITQQELQVLDKCVGYPEHYQHLMLPVWLSNSLEPDGLGVAQYCVPALTFIAQNKWTETGKPLNCDYALSQCIKSADLVTTEYRDSLKTMATQQPITA